MISKQKVLSLLGAAALVGSVNLALIEPAAAHVRVSAGIILTAPPAPIIETRISAPGAGFIWVGGYWNWVGGRHVWVPGRWMAPRRGYAWVPHAWVHERSGWRQHDGYWRRMRR